MDCETPHSKRCGRLEVIGWITEYPSTNLHMDSVCCYMPRSSTLQLVISEIIGITRDQCKHKIHYASNLESTTSRHTHTAAGLPSEKMLQANTTAAAERKEKKVCVWGRGGLKIQLEIQFLSVPPPTPSSAEVLIFIMLTASLRWSRWKWFHCSR